MARERTLDTVWGAFDNVIVHAPVIHKPAIFELRLLMIFSLAPFFSFGILGGYRLRYLLVYLFTPN